MSQKTSLLIPEHLDQLVTMVDDQQKAEYLQSVATPALKEMLRLAFDPAVTFDTPVPQYKPDDSPLGLAYNSLYSEYRRFYLFQPTTNLPITKKQNLLAQILESVHATEAAMVERVINKDLSDYDLTEDVVRMAFPDLLTPRAAIATQQVDLVVSGNVQIDVDADQPKKRARKPRAKKTVG